VQQDSAEKAGAMDLDLQREQTRQLRRSRDFRLVATAILVAAAIVAGAIIAAPIVLRFSPHSPGAGSTTTVTSAPQAALAQVADSLRANGDAGADEGGALSTLLGIARGVGKVASRADFIQAVQMGFASQLGAAPIELTQDAVGAVAGWLWDLAVGKPDGETTGDAIVRVFSERVVTNETIFRDSVVERHYMPAELRVAFTVLFTKSNASSGPEIDAQMQAFAQTWRSEIANRDCTALVRGAADTVGRDKDNYELSRRRAEKVAELLSTEFNLRKERISIETTGERGLASPTLDSVDALINRRVDVRIRCEP